MTRPEDIRQDVMDIAVSIEGDIPSRISGANRVFIRAVIARAIMAAEKRGEDRERDACFALAATHGRWGTTWEHNHTALPQVVSREIGAAIRKRGEQTP